MRNILLSILIFLSSTGQLVAASRFFCRVSNLASSNGLLEAHMSNAVQDKDGFMWFATWNGLVRYDGYNYYTFKPIQNSDGMISSNRIFNLKRTSNGNLWCVSSDNKLYLFDTGRCLFVNMHERLRCIKGKNVKTVTPLKVGTTWVTFKDNTCLRLVDRGPFSNFTFYGRGNKVLKGSEKINAVSQDSLGCEWILTDKAAVCADRRIEVAGSYRFVVSHGRLTWLVGEDGRMALLYGGKRKNLSMGSKDTKIKYAIYWQGTIVVAGDKGIERVFPSGRRVALGNVAADYLYIDSRDRLWAFGKSNAVALYSLDGTRQILNSTYRQQGEAMKNPQLIFENNCGQVVVKPEYGELSYYDEEAKALRPCLFYERSLPSDFSPAGMKKYLVDHNKNLWVFKEHETFCISFHPDNFVLRENSDRQECRLLALDDRGRLWASDRSLALYNILSDGGCNFYSRDGRRITRHEAFFSQPAYSFCQDSDRRIWIGTKGDGLYIMTPQAGTDKYKVEHFTRSGGSSGSVCSDSIYSIFQDKRGRMWLGTYGAGVFTAVRKQDGWRFSRCRDIPGNAKVRCFLEPKRDVLLIGTTSGLLSVDTRRMDRMACRVNAFRKESWGMKGNDVMAMTQCRGKVYLCVFGSGISEVVGSNYLSSDLHFINYSVTADATADQIKSAVSDGENIWVVADRSITKFSVKSKRSMTFDKSYFTESLNFSEAVPQIADGIVTVGTSRGIMSFSKDITPSNSQSGKLVFTGIQYTNDMTIRPLNDIDTLVISPGERSFSLYLSSLEYGADKDVRYRYKLSGYSEGWNYTSENQHAVCCDNIRPGEYTLVVETCGADGKWGAVRRSVPVVVTPLFVETMLFRFLMAVLVVGIFVALVYAVIYLNRMRRSLQRKYSLLMTVDELAEEMRTGEKLQVKEDGDKDFLEKNIRFLESNMSKEKLMVDDFARHLGMSRTAYYNKMKELTGLSPVEFIRQLRIKKALLLMEDGGYTITEVAYMTGFNDPKYFSRCFKAEMGMSPTAYAAEKDGKE